MSAPRPWTREETILAIGLYCVTPFGRIHARNPSVSSLAQRIGRTPSSVALKMCNFAALDPTLNRAGMGNFSKLDKEIWREFFANPGAFFDRERQAIESVAEIPAPRKAEPERPETEREAVTTARIGQGFFRKMVLSAYGYKCAITGIALPDLLVASHIVPWSRAEQHRTDPRNGICLNALHDRAFDRGPITIGEDRTLILSRQLDVTHEFLQAGQGKPLSMPERFLPAEEFLAFHRQNIFADRAV